jgi:hypothetical protein
MRSERKVWRWTCNCLVRIGNTTKSTLLRVMAAALPQLIAALERGEAVIEVTAT